MATAMPLGHRGCAVFRSPSSCSFWFSSRSTCLRCSLQQQAHSSRQLLQSGRKGRTEGSGRRPSTSSRPGQRPRCYTQAAMCLRVPAPEGHLKVAQQFTAGTGVAKELSDKSRRDGRNRGDRRSIVPSGLGDNSGRPRPSDESLGYYRTSLRDAAGNTDLCVTTRATPWETFLWPPMATIVRPVYHSKSQRNLTNAMRSSCTSGSAGALATTAPGYPAGS